MFLLRTEPRHSHHLEWVEPVDQHQPHRADGHEVAIAIPFLRKLAEKLIAVREDLRVSLVARCPLLSNMTKSPTHFRQAALVLGRRVAEHRQEVREALPDGLVLRRFGREVQRYQSMQQLPLVRSALAGHVLVVLTVSSYIIPASMSFATPSTATAWTSSSGMCKTALIISTTCGDCRQ